MLSYKFSKVAEQMLILTDVNVLKISRTLFC